MKIEDIHPETAQEWLLWYLLREVQKLNENLSPGEPQARKQKGR